LDADIQQAASCWENTLPFIVGNHFVGVVRHCGSEAEELGIRKGTRVASIVNWRCGSKSLTVPAANLAIVPSQLDAGDVATLVAYYLPAFQALHHGQPRRNRYSRNRLSGKKVLVAGGGALHAHAFMKLALWAGAEVYATKSSHHFDILGRMRSVIVLDDDGSRSPWPSENGGFMDIAVDFDYPRNFDFTRFSLAPTGRLICIRNKISSRIASDWMLGLEEFCDNYRLTLVPRASLYDFEENFEHHPDRTRSDLNFLMKLLATRQIRPQIDRYIKLEDVPRVHGEMQTLPPGGAIICDFWKE
jgi:NADPH:quinone reductase-like Zn-dependent oxidoreductase